MPVLADCLRKLLFVNRPVQGRLLGRTAGYWLLYHSVLWMVMFLFRYAEHRGAVMAGAAPRQIGDLYGEFVHQNYGMWVCAIAVLPIVLWELLQFSHRIVGPLVQFQQRLKQITDEEPEVPVQDIQLQEEDLLSQLSELQDSLNTFRAAQLGKQPTDVFRLEPPEDAQDVIAPQDKTVTKDGSENTEDETDTGDEIIVKVGDEIDSKALLGAGI